MAPARSASGNATASGVSQGRPLDGFTITLCGSFTTFGHRSHRSLEEVIHELGGNISKTVGQKTTHVVCTEVNYTYNEGKVQDARKNGLPLVHPQWLLELIKQRGTYVDPKDYDWADWYKKDSGTSVTDAAGTNGKKRTITTTHDDAGENNQADQAAEPDPKKTKSRKTEDGNSDETGKSEIEKSAADGQFVKNKERALVPVDEFCPLATQGYEVYIDAEEGLIWDAALNQTNATHNNNKFYKIQILHRPGKDWKTWTRWGRVGESGAHTVLGDGSLKSARASFEKKFKDKSGLPWDRRDSDPKPGKYAFIERSYDPDSDGDGDDKQATVDQDDGQPAPICSLSKPVKELLGLIFNEALFAAAIESFNYDANKMPLGKLSKTTITRGFQQLKDLAALLDDVTLAETRWNMSLNAATEHLSNTYYSLIPHAFGRTRPPVISNAYMLKNELTLLESLSDMKEAADIMKINGQAVKGLVHPLDEQYQRLGMNEMTALEPNTREFTKLEEYLQGSKGRTHGMQYRVKEIFRIERQGEKQRFDSSKFATIASDKRLLWHGSRVTNFGGILSQGLRIAPPEAPVSGYAFGKGIYLADMSTKSAGYCCHFNSNNEALLLLCEAELGAPMHELTSGNSKAREDAQGAGKVATWGQGRTGPAKWVDGKSICEGLKGIKVPDPTCAPSDTGFQGGYLEYNEYICYDVAQVKLRYLFRVKIF